MKRLLALALFVPAFGGVAVSAPGDVSLAKPVVASPQAQLGNEKLQAKYDDLWKSFQAKVEEGDSSVEQELARLYESAKTAGKLDLALFWTEMKKSFADTGRLAWEPSKLKKEWKKRFGDSEFPDELTTVFRKCEVSFREATNGLEAGYKELEAELTKADKLEEALRLRSELKDVLARKSSERQTETQPELQRSSRPASSIVGFWIGEGGWSKEFREDNSVHNFTPQGQLDIAGVWKEEGAGQYSAKLGEWSWQIIVKRDDMQVARFLNGEPKGKGTYRRRR